MNHEPKIQPRVANVPTSESTRPQLTLRVEALEDRLAPASFRFGGDIFQFGGGPLRFDECCT